MRNHTHALIHVTRSDCPIIKIDKIRCNHIISPTRQGAHTHDVRTAVYIATSRTYDTQAIYGSICAAVNESNDSDGGSQTKRCRCCLSIEHANIYGIVYTHTLPCLPLLLRSNDFYARAHVYAFFSIFCFCIVYDRDAELMGKNDGGRHRPRPPTSGKCAN